MLELQKSVSCNRSSHKASEKKEMGNYSGKLIKEILWKKRVTQQVWQTSVNLEKDRTKEDIGYGSNLNAKPVNCLITIY